MSEHLASLIQEIIKKTIHEEFNVNIDDVELEIPNNKEHGHLSTNVCLKNSKVIGKNPFDVANVIKLDLIKNENIKHIEVIKPGFINIYLSNKYFGKTLEQILNEGYNFSKTNKNINVEYVSANPTGELHLGHARNAAFGDSLAKLLEKVGNNITKEYYINDAGVQMQNLGKSVQSYYLQNFQDAPFPEDGYKGKEIKEIAQKLYEEYSNKLINESLDFFIQYAYKYNMDEIKKVLDRINVEFDVYSSENYYHEQGYVSKVIELLEKKGDVYNQDGAKWLKTTKYGDDKDRVLEKSDGTHTYLTSDIAYHEDKFLRTQGKLINIWGADHHGYIKRVEAAMQSLGHDPDDLITVFIQLVSISENKEKVKMSKRAGTSVTIKDLLDIIDPDSLRYFFIMRSPDTQLDFDLALAHEQNSSNPIFYIQYAHARICSILSKEGYVKSNIKIDYDSLNNDELSLIYKLDNYKNVLLEASRQLRPHMLTNYIYELAAEFHKYYNNNQIIVDDLVQKENKLLLCIGIKETISDCLEILGIKAKEKM